eukprot:11404381-Ditylum_brightwellii.AAC.1
MKKDVQVVIQESVPSQLTLSKSVLRGPDFTGVDCKATVTVSAISDGKVEGDHFVILQHIVQNVTNSNKDIILSDKTPLFAANVLVTLYDAE